MYQMNFSWFIGVVVDIKDPEKSGKVRIRIINEHFDKIESGDLIWANVMMPATSASYDGQGWSPTGIAQGSYVVGFYMDGEDKALPMVMGTFHIPKRASNDGKSDVNPIAMGDGPVDKTRLDYEPETTYAAQYPLNKVYKSGGGHVIEMDDTPGSERIHVYHSSGSYIEMGPEGDIISRSKSNLDITIDSKVIICDKGDLLIECKEGGITIKSPDNVTIESSGVIALDAPLISING